MHCKKKHHINCSLTLRTVSARLGYIRYFTTCENESHYTNNGRLYCWAQGDADTVHRQ